MDGWIIKNWMERWLGVWRDEWIPSIFSDNKSVNNLTNILLYVTNGFSLADFQVFHLLCFETVGYDVSGVAPSDFILLVVC